MSFSITISGITGGTSISTVGIYECIDSSCTNCTLIPSYSSVDIITLNTPGITILNINDLSTYIKIVPNGVCSGNTLCLEIKNKPTPTPTTTSTPTETSTPTPTSTDVPPPIPTPTPTETITPTPTPTETITPTPTETVTPTIQCDDCYSYTIIVEPFGGGGNYSYIGCDGITYNEYVGYGGTANITCAVEGSVLRDVVLQGQSTLIQGALCGNTCPPPPTPTPTPTITETPPCPGGCIYVSLVDTTTTPSSECEGQNNTTNTYRFEHSDGPVCEDTEITYEYISYSNCDCGVGGPESQTLTGTTIIPSGSTYVDVSYNINIDCCGCNPCQCNDYGQYLDFTTNPIIDVPAGYTICLAPTLTPTPTPTTSYCTCLTYSLQVDSNDILSATGNTIFSEFNNMVIWSYEDCYGNGGSQKYTVAGTYEICICSNVLVAYYENDELKVATYSPTLIGSCDFTPTPTSTPTSTETPTPTITESGGGLES